MLLNPDRILKIAIIANKRPIFFILKCQKVVVEGQPRQEKKDFDNCLNFQTQSFE